MADENTVPEESNDSVLPEDLVIRHGDYLRIAELTRRTNGRPYRSDYVRKVLNGFRHNKEIVKIAKRYLRRQQKQTQEMMGD
ncbi:MAG TPA: hypothetical protein DCE41_11595 [Cytophagales bacterium]|nr:hypothetical protein [Cytophagales bacterium]HAA22337.1 hypothetical protein [Cytophagales bacterium]HAP60453.1 hypothetical protein [Cytophagales bacterium]